MNWQEIQNSEDNTYFLFDGNPLFGKRFVEVLKFHAPGLAPVKDESGAYHIDLNGDELYIERFSRTFGYYCNRAAVVHGDDWVHLTDKGLRAYPNAFSWTGNFQENLCTVRDFNNSYFHIDLKGVRIYGEDYLYAGDYKDGIACVKKYNGFYKHINTKGEYINDKEFHDLGVFHKKFATAKDQDGWFHIDLKGEELYPERYLAVEPFYNGFALVENYINQKQIINEDGNMILSL